MRKVIHDLLGRDSGESDLHNVDYMFDRGLTRTAYTKDFVRGGEVRMKAVQDAFQHDLGRPVDTMGLNHWLVRLKTITLPELHAQLLASNEAYRRAGSTNRGYVRSLYQLVHGRTPDRAGEDYWTRRLDAGTSRLSLARLLLTSHESAQRTVVQAYTDLLQRAPDASGKAHWTAVLEKGADPRDLWRTIILGNEFDRKAQAAA